MPIDLQIKKGLASFLLDIQFQTASSRIGVLGASGCGKSMALKCIAGIEAPQEGRIQLGGALFFDSSQGINVTPQKRNIGYLFQNYALFPHMTVAQNIAAGLKGAKAWKKARAEEMMRKFRLLELSGQYPSCLSGGQQQRVALARIMAYQPASILLDEPFSALDVYLQDQLQRELLEMLEGYQGTVILVSHSRDEIYRFSEEILILDQGRNIVSGKTREVFANPIYQEAARLTGCKNFSEIRRMDSHSIEAIDWGCVLRFERPIPPEAGCIGYRAHDFVPIWGEAPRNALLISEAERADLPFETNFYIRPSGGRAMAQPVCWFVQRSQMQEIGQKGLPSCLQLQEEKIMFLKKAIHRGESHMKQRDFC